MGNALPSYRCFALMRPNGGWSRWRFAPDRAETYRQLLHNAGREVLFASVQHFPPPLSMAGFLKWGEGGEQYKNENAMPHLAPLYFDIDCADGLDDALTLAHGLHEFFTGELDIAPAHVRVWFSGSKGAHLLVHPEVLGIAPSPTLTTDMKPIALGLCQRLAREYGVPDLSADDKVYSMPRMLRCENQLNPRSGLYKVRLTPEELATCDSERIKGLAVSPRTVQEEESLPAAIPVSEKARAWWAEQLKEAHRPREFQQQTARITGATIRPDGFAEDELIATDMPDCVSKLLKAKPLQGTRNRIELQLACWARAAGRNEADATNLLARWIFHNRPELLAPQVTVQGFGTA